MIGFNDYIYGKEFILKPCINGDIKFYTISEFNKAMRMKNIVIGMLLTILIGCIIIAFLSIWNLFHVLKPP